MDPPHAADEVACCCIGVSCDTVGAGLVAAAAAAGSESMSSNTSSVKTSSSSHPSMVVV